MVNTPISFTTRGPRRSMRRPSMGLRMAETTKPKENAPAVIPRSQPNSARMGGKRISNDEEVKPMGYNLEQFADTVHRILKENPGPAGREKVCAVVQEVLVDESFLKQHLGDDVPERKILYEDPELGFCILAHHYLGAKESAPHDHGPTWAIYGQARGETLMNDWALVQPPAEGKPGKVRHVRSYPLTPGMAHVYNEGDLHSPKREGPTRLIRIEGQNVEKIKRFSYEKV